MEAEEGGGGSRSVRHFPMNRKVTVVSVPVRTRSEANLREHWAKRARRVKKQRNAARMLVRAAITSRPSGNLTVRLVRIAPRKLDSDNLASSLKAVRDGVADALGIDDGDERIRWQYAQGKGRPGEYGVLVEINQWN